MLSRKYLGLAGTISLSFGLMTSCSDESTSSTAKSITGGISAEDIQEIANNAGISGEVSESNVCLFEGYSGYYAADGVTIMCMDATGALAFWINTDGSYGFPNEKDSSVENTEQATSSTSETSNTTQTSSGSNSAANVSSSATTAQPAESSSNSVATGCSTEKAAYTIAGTDYYFDASQRKYYYYDANCVLTYVENQVTNSSASVGKSSASTGKSSASFGGNSSAVVSSSDSQVATSSETTVVNSSATATSSSGTSIIGGGDTDDGDNEDAKTLDGTETLITVSGTSSTIQNDNGCLVQGDKKLTITCSGAYYFTGTASDYQVLVSVANASDVENVGIYLYNLDMTSTSAPFIVTNAEKTVFHIVKGTTNKLADGNGNHEFTKKDGSTDIADAVIYAKDDINFKGAGSLTLTSNYITASDTGSGIKCSNDIKIKNGNITITAQNNGIKGKGSVQISGGNLNITTKYGDGIKSDDCIETNGECTAVAADGKGFVNITGGTINVTAADDGIYGYNYVSIADTVETPKITIKTGSGSADKSSSESMGRPGQQQQTTTSSDDNSYKGIKASQHIWISAGEIDIKAQRDAVHSNKGVYVTGGNITAVGRNGAHADDTLSITGGTFAVTDSYEGFESKNILLGGNATTYVYASDDSWNASDGTEDSCNDCYVRVSGGKHYSIGFGDGLDSNYGMEFTGGIVLAAQSGGGNGIFDLGGGNMNVTGNAVVLGVGTSEMTVCPTATTSIKATGSYAQGSIVAISNGSTLVGAIKLPFSAAQIQYAYSSGSYTVTTGGSFNGTYEFNYFATSGSVSGGSAVSGSTCSNSGGMGGGGRW